MLFNFFLKINHVNKNINVNMLTPVCGKNENFTDFFVFNWKKNSQLIEKELIFLTSNFKGFYTKFLIRTQSCDK